LHFLFELLSWGFGRKLVYLSHHWRRNCHRLGLLSSLLLLFPSHHLIEFVFILLPENSCSLLPFGNEIIGSCQIIEPVLFNILLTFFQVDIIIPLKKIHDHLINGYLISSDNYSLFFIWLHLVVPRVISYVFNSKSLGGIRVKNRLKEIFGLLTKKCW